MARFSVPSASSSPTISEASFRTLSCGSESPRNRATPRSPERTLLPRSAIRKPVRTTRPALSQTSLITVDERAGKVPRLGLRSQSPGLSWEDGAIRWTDVAKFPAYARPGEKYISREVVEDAGRAPRLDGFGDLEKLLMHKNLVNLCGREGLEQDNTLTETTWHFNDAGTLNCSILSKRRPARLPTATSVEGLPETLVWHTLKSLLSAVLWLHQGTHDYGETWKRPGWKPVVHNFINPANIFYSHPIAEKDGSTPLYGDCKLGNFSRCVVLQRIADPEDDDEDRERKEAFDQVHAIGEETGYEAPELVGDGDEIPGPESDLWSIGAVMVAMMTGRTIWDLLLEMEFADHVRARRRSGRWQERWQSVPVVQRHALLSRPKGGPNIAAALPAHYSFDLRTIVEALLVFDPILRADAAEMLRDVEMLFEIRTAEGMTDYAEPSAAQKLAEARKRLRELRKEAMEFVETEEAID